MGKLVVAGGITSLAAVAALTAFLGRSSVQQPAPSAAPAPGAPRAQPGHRDSLIAPRLSVADSGMLKGPRQPIFFRHDIHAGQFKIPCQYCHYTAAQSSEPGIPSLETCMGCHQVISGADSTDRKEVQKLRQFWGDSANRTTPRLEWVRVHAIARYVKFPHNVHIKAMGVNACQTCHGDVARMPQVFRVNTVTNMGFCITCHVERNVNRDCTACHY